MAPPLVLVVDDDEDVRDLLGLVLGGRGYSVEYAENGREALARLRADGPCPALVLLDLVMPVMSGSTLLEILQGDPGLRDIPVVVVSARADERPPGAVEYLVKPPDVEALLAVAARYCRDASG